MESETLETSWISSTTKGTSWPIVRGSLKDSVTFESSISAADPDHPVTQRPKTPLLLRRSSPDCGPCEITVCLAHKHEIRQVYVRSTARVYEIYCATDDKGGDDYLCTVRCSLSAKNVEPVQLTDAVGSVPARYSGNRCGEEGNSGNESGSSTNEDGWVDVDPSGFDSGNRSLSNKTESCSELGNQHLFEATAEISDADPVKSVTLRFLSMMSGDYIYIDEVYIYADPLIPEDTDSSLNMPENSSGSALMSMLVPTLLQLSKSRMSQTRKQNDSVATESHVNLNAVHKSTSPVITSSTFQSQGTPNSNICGSSILISQPEAPVLSGDRENRSSSSHLERTLEELVLRISSIETFCFRFEENMLKPISSMNARLEKVEQQLESLCKNSVNENDIHGHATHNSVKNDDCCHDEMSVRQEEHSVLPSEQFLPDNLIHPSEVPSSTSASHLHPGLVVTAPDFSCIDDDEENDAIEEVRLLPVPLESPKKALSIDDALASALAGFLSSTSTGPSKCTDTVDEALDLPSGERCCENFPLSVGQYVAPDVSSIDVDGTNPPVNISHEYSAEIFGGSLVNIEKCKVEDSDSIEADNVTGETFVSEGNIDPSSEEGLKVNYDALQNIYKSTTVDFEIPILDVKFSWLANPSGKSPLESLVEMPESHNENSMSDPSDMVLTEDGDSATSGNQFFNNYDSCSLPLKREEPHDSCSYSDHDVSPSLI